MQPQLTNEDYSVFDNMMEGVLVIDYNWNFAYVNKALAQQAQTTPEAMLGKPVTEQYPIIVKLPIYKKIQRCLDEKIPGEAIIEFPFPNREKGWFELKLEPVKDGAFIMTFEVTRQRQLTMELRNLNKELEQRVELQTRELIESLNREKELNQMKTALVSMASHEIKTPLHSVLLSMNLIERYGSENNYPKQHVHIEKVKSTVSYLNKILNNFLALENLEHGKMRPDSQEINLKEYLNEIVDQMANIAKEDQKIIHEYAGDLTAHTNKLMLRQVMINLLSNAIKYSKKDIHITTHVAQGQINIAVKDQGIGIPEKDQQQLFNKFYRAENTAGIKGNGLGLNIVKQYVELLDGEISFTSEQNKGTTFNFWIPQKLKPSEKPEITPEPIEG